MKSIERGNFLLGVHINSIRGKNQLSKEPGPNPFDSLGLQIDDAGIRATPTEWKDGKWNYYSDLDPFLVPEQPEPNREHLRLSHWFPAYDWVAGRGYDNFSKWIS